MCRVTRMTIGTLLALGFARDVAAAIVYSVAGSIYAENFDSLPVDASNNSSIETIYPDGWRDDTGTVPATHVSVPGWYLYHPISPANENGFSGNQRFRMGFGQNTGGFWGFGAFSFEPEKALGSIGSTTTAGNDANFYMALRLFNSTGLELTSFTLTFDGEEWRDGEAPAGETLSFAFSTSATPADWFSTAVFKPVVALSFTSPVATGTNPSGLPVDGNVQGLVSGITATVAGISWLPGTDLWLRWADPQLAGFADDGLAIDNVSFSALPEPASGSLFAIAAVALVSRCRTGVRRGGWQNASDAHTGSLTH